MYIFTCLTVTTFFFIVPVFTSDVCINQRCQCSPTLTTVNCDTKGWKNLDDIDFPSSVHILTLVHNNLKFDTINDRVKIENLPNLIDLSINQNPLGTIPLFNNTKIRFLSLQDTSLTSAEFPSCYNGSFLQRISLSDNKILSIKENDFNILRNSPLKRLHLDSASISMIGQTAFAPLTQLQSLTLINNQLKSCEFLSSLILLSSIQLDGNRFTSLPQELSTPRKIKIYSFTNNLITTIDDTSPLYQWWKMNKTDIKIYLANNSFDCCLSLWFIRLLKISPQFVADASLLTCASPLKYAGKSLLKLNPDEMNCSGDDPNQSWWTVGRIIGIVFGCIVAAITVIAIVFVRYRRQPSRSGYTPIGETDELYSQIDSSVSRGPAFPMLNDDYDPLPTPTYVGSTRSLFESEAPTHTTYSGTYAIDGSQADGSQIQEAVLMPNTLESV